jgi:hypothetical protein
LSEGLGFTGTPQWQAKLRSESLGLGCARSGKSKRDDEVAVGEAQQF